MNHLAHPVRRSRYMRHLISIALVALALPVAAMAKAKPQDVHISWACPDGSYPNAAEKGPNCNARSDSPGAQALQVKEQAPIAAAAPMPGGAATRPSPQSEAERVQAAKLVPFDTSSSELDDASKGTLDELAQSITSDPSINAVRIVGHADKTGISNENDQLAADRAEAVRSYLEQQGVPANKLSVTSRGDTAPKATNESDAGRALNRSAVVITLR